MHDLLRRPIALVRRRQVRQILTTAGVTYLGMALSLVSAPMVARALGAEGRGALAASFVVTQTIAFVMFLGLPRTLSLEYVRGKRISALGVALLALLGIAGGAIVFATAPAVAQGDDRILLGARVAALSFPLVGLSQLGAQEMLARGRTAAYNLYRILPLVVPSVVSIIAFSVDGLTLLVAYVSTLASMVASNLLGCVYAIPAIRNSARHVDLDWPFSLRFWSAIALDNLGARLDQFAGAVLISAQALGVYVVAAVCASAAGALTQAINQVSYSRLLAHERRLGRIGQGAGLSRRHTVVRLSVSILSACFISVAAWLVGPALFGPDFAELGEVATVLCAAQVLKDQWQWTMYSSTAAFAARGLAWASAAGLLVMGVAIAGFVSADQLGPVTLAVSSLAFASTRLAVRALLARRQQTERVDQAQNPDSFSVRAAEE